MRSRKKIKIKNLLSRNYTQAIEIPVSFSLEEPDFLFPLIRKSLVKFTAFILIAALNWAGLSAVIQTIANFNDTEGSPQNIFVAGTLDFSLPSTPDFSPVIMPNATSSRNISLTNDGILGFQYTATTTNATGTLCNFLNLEAKLDGTTTYIGPLTSFNFNANEFSTSTDDWQFTATLTSNSSALQNKTCKFDFVFDGEQIEGAGFYDQEIISNTITSGVWLKVVINKVYYDPDNEHSGNGPEKKYEWIELYNPTDQDIDLKKWGICNSSDCATIDNHITIPALGYALVVHDATIWQYWEIIDGAVFTYTLSGNFEMDDTADMLILKDAGSYNIDQMNWGTPTTTWPNYNSGVWDPGVPDAPQGHMLARVPSGFDTDQPSDWHDLGLPSVVIIYPAGGETWYVGHTYNIQWTATNPNGPHTDLSIDIYYSRDSGATWAAIATSTQNDGSYNWLAPLFIEPGHYYVPSSHARIKVKATGPENFMVQAWVSSNDFCPPIDYDVLSPEDQQLVDQLIKDGVIDESEVVRGGIKIDEQEVEVVNEEIATSTEETATPTEETLVPVGSDSTDNGNQESGGIIETVNEAIDAADETIDAVVEGIIEEIMPDESVNEPAEFFEASADNLIAENLIIEQAPIETLIFEQAPAIEEQTVIAPETDSAEPPADE